MRKWILVSLMLLACLSLAVARGTTDAPAEEEEAEVVEEKPAPAAAVEEPAVFEATGQIVFYADPAAYEAAEGSSLPPFKEAPTLSEKVAGGALPSVDQRVPQEPLVIQPAEAIGLYCGDMVSAHVGSLGELEDTLREFPFHYSSNLQEIVPNIFKDFEILDGAKSFVFSLRKGMKWDDGQPFTADDIMFWYLDIVLNQDLRPRGESSLKVGGEMGVVEKIDEYTVKYSFKAPYGVFFEALCRWRPVPYAPAHYLKGFHPNFTPADELDKKIKAGEFSSWIDLFEAERYYPNNPNTPTISAWKTVNKYSEAVQELERNPYYWKVDVAGNQLPYAEGLLRFNVNDDEALLLKAMAGEIDYERYSNLGADANFPILKKNTDKGGYRVTPGLAAGHAVWGLLHFNLSHEDTVLRDIFRERDFRVALNIAIDHDSINELIFKGLFQVCNPGPPHGPPNYGGSEDFVRDTEYDLERANRLLDELGLGWGSDKKWRLRPDGKPLQFVLLVHTRWPQQVPIAELYKKYWEAVGVDMTIKPVGRSLYGEIVGSGKFDVGSAPTGYGGMRPHIAGLRPQVFPIRDDWQVNASWGAWMVSGGTAGEEPPEDVKRLYQLQQDFVAEPDEGKRNKIMDEAYAIHNKNRWVLGGFKRHAGIESIFYNVFTNRMHNMPIPFPGDYYYGVPSTWYIDE